MAHTADHRFISFSTWAVNCCSSSRIWPLIYICIIFFVFLFVRNRTKWKLWIIFLPHHNYELYCLCLSRKIHPKKFEVCSFKTWKGSIGVTAFLKHHIHIIHQWMILFPPICCWRNIWPWNFVLNFTARVQDMIELVSKWQPVKQVALHKLFTKFLGTPIVKREI